MPLCSKYTVPKKKTQRKQSRESLCHPKSWVRSVKRLLDQCRQPQNTNYPFACLLLLLPWQTGSYFCGSMKNSTVHIVCGVSKPDSGSRFFPLAACLWMCGAHMLGVQRRLANCLFFCDGPLQPLLPVLQSHLDIFSCGCRFWAADWSGCASAPPAGLCSSGSRSSGDGRRPGSEHLDTRRLDGKRRGRLRG